MAVGKFRSYVWDPILILSQIIAVQATFYLFLGLWLFLVNTAAGNPVIVFQLFDPSIVNFTNGKLYLCVFALNSLSSSVCLWYIVQRAKQCLDFTVTSHFIHFLCCWCYFSFPTSWVWWLMNFICIILTSLLSEYLCMCDEMKAIPLINSSGS